jgi:hypothetical protein
VNDLNRPYFTVPEVVAALGGAWSARRVRRWLQRGHACEKLHGTIVIPVNALAHNFPELYRALLERDIGASYVHGSAEVELDDDGEI